MDNIFLILILLTLVGGAAYYIYRAKQRGQTCIGCPHSKQCQKGKTACSSKEHGDCSCGCH